MYMHIQFSKLLFCGIIVYYLGLSHFVSNVFIVHFRNNVTSEIYIVFQTVCSGSIFKYCML